MTGVGKSTIWGRFRAMGIKKVKGQYDVTPELLEVIKKKPEKGISAKLKLSKKYGVSHFVVGNLASHLGISVRHEKLPEAVELKKTGFYTTKGIKHILGL